MASKTPKYELRRKEDNDFYDFDDLNENWDKVENALTEFDDSGSVDGITSFTEMLTRLVTGNKLAVTLRNLKAGLQFVLHTGSIVNNCVTDNPNLPLSAAQGKALQDALTKLNGDLKSRLGISHYISGSITAYADTCPMGLTVVVTGNDTTQMAGMASRYTIGFVLNRASDSGVVILFSYSNNEIYMISKNGTTWDSKVSAKW